MELRKKSIEELIELKDDCYINNTLEKEMVDKYAARVELYKEQGYKVRIHELVLEIFYERLNGINPKSIENTQRYIYK